MRDLDPVTLTLELLEIPSPSGQERAVALAVADHCRQLGFDVSLTDAAPGRPNVLALSGTPAVVLCTHLDTVPPELPVRSDETSIYGRGACDAKGIVACMLRAAQHLKSEGQQGFGLLFVVAEETDSLGAKSANQSWDFPTRAVIVGEPTDNRLAIAQKGILTARLRFRGRAAHGAYPEAGRSAIRSLSATLAGIYRGDWGRCPRLGENVLNVGKIQGGVAVNVIPPTAEAWVQIRVATSVAEVEERLRELAGPEAEVTIAQTSEPLELNLIPGLETMVAGFGTDLPYLTNLGRRYLLGPGSILDAHTSHEKVLKRDLHRASELYYRTAKQLLRS